MCTIITTNFKTLSIKNLHHFMMCLVITQILCVYYSIWEFFHIVLFCVYNEHANESSVGNSSIRLSLTCIIKLPLACFGTFPTFPFAWSFLNLLSRTSKSIFVPIWACPKKYVHCDRIKCYNPVVTRRSNTCSLFNEVVISFEISLKIYFNCFRF